MQIVRLFDENALLCDLQTRTVNLIHATYVVDAIKKLVSAYDIISLNIEIQERFKGDDPIWDLSALKDLNHTRIELVLYHRTAFKPMSLIDQYNGKMVSLLKLIKLKHTSFDLNI